MEEQGTLLLRGPATELSILSPPHPGGQGRPGGLREAWRTPARWVSRACLCSNNGSSSLPEAPASSLLGGRCQGMNFHYDEVSSAQTQRHAKGCQWRCRKLSKGRRDASSVPRFPPPCPEPMPAQRVFWAPARPPAHRRTAGKRQGRERGS